MQGLRHWFTAIERKTSVRRLEDSNGAYPVVRQPTIDDEYASVRPLLVGLRDGEVGLRARRLANGFHSAVIPRSTNSMAPVT